MLTTERTDELPDVIAREQIEVLWQDELAMQSKVAIVAKAIEDCHRV